MKANVTSPIRFSKRKSVGGNIIGRWIIVETVAHALDISFQMNIDNIQYMYKCGVNRYQIQSDKHEAVQLSSTNVEFADIKIGNWSWKTA